MKKIKRLRECVEEFIVSQSDGEDWSSNEWVTPTMDDIVNKINEIIDCINNDTHEIKIGDRFKIINQTQHKNSSVYKHVIGMIGIISYIGDVSKHLIAY